MAGNLLLRLTEGLSKRLKSESLDRLMSKAKFISAGDGRVVCKMILEKMHQNSYGTLHGGMTCTLIDNITGYALLTKQCRGVSVDLNVSFLNPIKIGQTILIEARLLKLGQRIAFAEAEIRDADSDKILAIGRHTLAVTENNVAIEDGC